jgi:hypothetical protein
MEQLLLVNPSPKRRKRRLPPRGPGGQFLKRGSRRTASRKRRRRNPIPGASVIPANPVRRHRRRSVSRGMSRRRRRNPSGGRGFLGALTAPLMPAVVGAGGAIANEVAFKFLPLPANLKTGMIGTLARAAVAVGVGMALDRVAGRRIASQMTAGALTVLAYGQLRSVLATAAPNLVGEYISGDDEMGYYGAGTVLNAIPGSLDQVPNSLSEDFSVGEYISGDDFN